MQPTSGDEGPKPRPLPEGGPRRLHFPMRRHRLPGSGFTRAYAHGRRARGSSFTVVVHPNEGSDRRLGLSVGKRCWKSAVKRNRVRRVFREAFRLEQAELPQGIDVVLVASTPALVPDLPTCRRELRKLTWKAWRRYLEANEGNPVGPGRSRS